MVVNRFVSCVQQYVRTVHRVFVLSLLLAYPEVVIVFVRFRWGTQTYQPDNGHMLR